MYDGVSGDEDATSSVGGSSINGFKLFYLKQPILNQDHLMTHNGLEIVTLPTHGKIYSNNNEGDDSPEMSYVGSTMNNIEDGYGARIWYVQDTEHWNGNDTFTYKANDGEADSNIATVNNNKCYRWCTCCCRYNCYYRWRQDSDLSKLYKR